MSQNQSNKSKLSFSSFSGFGLLGILGNLLAMYVILRSPKLRSVFNHILVCHLSMHTAFIVATFLIEVFKLVGGFFLHYLFANFLYAFRPLIFNASIFLTVLMAKERNFAIRVSKGRRKNKGFLRLS